MNHNNGIKGKRKTAQRQAKSDIGYLKIHKLLEKFGVKQPYPKWLIRSKKL